MTELYVVLIVYHCRTVSTNWTDCSLPDESLKKMAIFCTTNMVKIRSYYSIETEGRKRGLVITPSEGV